jgi:hypothetical protein
MIRTPGVYLANGRDFVKNAPDLSSPQRWTLSPTGSELRPGLRGVAEAFWELARNGAYALCTIGRERGSWHDLAVAVVEFESGWGRPDARFR